MVKIQFDWLEDFFAETRCTIEDPNIFDCFREPKGNFKKKFFDDRLLVIYMYTLSSCSIEQ
jgi:hypothetical protein